MEVYDNGIRRRYMVEGSSGGIYCRYMLDVEIYGRGVIV